MSIRRTKGTLQVETQVFTKGGKTVVLCGVMHVAEPRFWKYVSALVRGAEERGHEIQYEGVQNDLGRTVQLGPDFTPVATAIGLQAQRDGLEYGNAWVNADIQLSELIASLSPDKLAKVEAQSAEQASELTEILAGPHAKMAKRFVRWVLGYMHILGRLPIGAFGISRTVILSRRNQAAYEGIKSTSKSVATIWGAAHLPGIGRRLKADGYKLAGSTWATVLATKA